MNKILDDLPERSPQGGERWIAAIFSAHFLFMTGMARPLPRDPSRSDRNDGGAVAWEHRASTPI